MSCTEYFYSWCMIYLVRIVIRIRHIRNARSIDGTDGEACIDGGKGCWMRKLYGFGMVRKITRLKYSWHEF